MIEAVEQLVSTQLEPDDKHPNKRPRLLVIEDNEITRKLLVRMLHEHYATEWASSVDEALSKAMASAYDALLVDIDLGERRTGVEVMHILRKEPLYKKASFVACTAYSLPGIRDRFLEAGFDEFISKPFTRQQLLETLDAAERHAPVVLPKFAEEVRLELPPLPSTVPQILQLMGKKHEVPDTYRLQEILRQDPVASSWLLHHINSSYYSLRSKISDADRAVIYRGFDPVCNMVLTHVISRSFTPLDSLRAQQVYRRILQYSIATATFARHLAYFLDVPKPEMAFTSGLFCQLGRLALLSDNPEGYAKLWTADGDDVQLLPPTVGQELIRCGHGHIGLGTQIATKWKLPQDIVSIIRHQGNPEATLKPPIYHLSLAVGAGLAAAHNLIDKTTDGDGSALRRLATARKVCVERLQQHVAEKQDDVRGFLEMW